MSLFVSCTECPWILVIRLYTLQYRSLLTMIHVDFKAQIKYFRLIGNCSFVIMIEMCGGGVGRRLLNESIT